MSTHRIKIVDLHKSSYFLQKYTGKKRRDFCKNEKPPVERVVFICSYKIFMQSSRRALQHNTIFKDRNSPVTVFFVFGLLAGSHRYHLIKQALARFGNGFAFRYRTSVEVYPALFALCQRIVGGNFQRGSGAPNGVPRPVVNKTICAPAAVKAVADTKSLPGPDSMFRPFVTTASP